MKHEPTNTNDSNERKGEEARSWDVDSQFGFDDSERWMKLVQVATSSGVEGPDMIGAFKVLEHAGRGGQGSVYKVLHPQTGRAIALKRLALGSFASTRDRVRFQRELQATASLSHPCIVTLLGHETIDHQPVLLMEWVDGQPIDLWARRKDVSVRDVLALFARLCDAAAHAHQRGVLHRDLKPGNVLVVRHDASVGGRGGSNQVDFEPKVLDFGLSRLERQGERSGGHAQASEQHAIFTATQGFMGTPAYVAPEQASARWNEVDTRSDVYAIGVMLYQALTGKLPFESGDLASLLTAISHEEPDRPSSVLQARARGVDREVDAIVMKAIAKQASQRYQSADAFANDLRRKLAGQTVLAHPPKLMYQTRAFARQHRTAVFVSCAALGALAGLAIVSTVLATRLSVRSSELVAAATAQEEATQLARDREAVARSAASTLRDMLEQIVVDATEAGVVAPEELTQATLARLRAGEFAQLPEIELGLWNLIARLAMTGSDFALWDECIARGEEARGRVAHNHAEVGLFENTVGLRYESKGDLAASLEHYQAALPIVEGAYGRLHTSTMRVLSNLAGMTRRSGNWEAAVHLLKDLLERRIEAHGPRALSTASAWSQLAQALRVGKQHEESRAALAMATEIVDWETQGKRPEAIRVAREMSRRGRADGDAAMEERGLKLGIEAHRLPRGTGFALESYSQFAGAEFYVRQQRFDEALALMEEVHAIDMKHKVAGDINRAKGLVLLAEELGRRGEAQAEVRVRAKEIALQAQAEWAKVAEADEASLKRVEACVQRAASW